jgi:tetratricopeptide (TPR) repeat protein
MDARRQQTQELRRQIEWTLARAADPADVLPMLHRLTRLAHDGSEDSVFAHLHLAELLVERDPWRAALFSRRVLAHRPDDDRGWATLALCQTMLGNYKFAVNAYHRALASAPKNPWYAHNLGHLLDVALGRAPEAIGWLKRAYQSATDSAEVAASYGHALARVGRLAEARKVLTRAMRKGGSRELAALLKWLEQGAPPEKDHPLPRPAPVHTIAVRSTSPQVSPSERGSKATTDRKREDSATARRALRAPQVAELETVLARGLSSLPLDAKQRARAKALGRDALEYFSRPAARAPTAGASAAARGGIDAIAAAIAYAIVYVDHVPLTPAEVAACFRVGVASLRGRFGELRSHLDLLPGDVRYATLRRR